MTCGRGHSDLSTWGVGCCGGGGGVEHGWRGLVICPRGPLRVGQRSGCTSTHLGPWPCDSSLVAAGLWGPVEWRVEVPPLCRRVKKGEFTPEGYFFKTLVVSCVTLRQWREGGIKSESVLQTVTSR